MNTVCAGQPRGPYPPTPTPTWDLYSISRNLQGDTTPILLAPMAGAAWGDAAFAGQPRGALPL